MTCEIIAHCALKLNIWRYYTILLPKQPVEKKFISDEAKIVYTSAATVVHIGVSVFTGKLYYLIIRKTKFYIRFFYLSCDLFYEYSRMYIVYIQYAYWMRNYIIRQR